MFENVIKKIKKAKRVGIFTHINPDGDAMGSAFSLKAVLEDMGKTADVFYSGAVEPRLLELVVGAQESAKITDGCDLLIALDCAAADRLGVWSDEFLNHKNTAAIDHHVTHIEFAGDTVVGDISSTCELMYTLYIEMGIKIPFSAATNLYIGMATDTGNFKFSSVTGDTHRIIAELIDADVDFAGISKKLFDTVSKEYLDLKMRAINNMRYCLDGKVAILKLEKADFDESGISETAASSIVTLPVSVEGVEVGVYIRHRMSEGYKVSLRSVSCVDVSEIASVFGGGGHVRAAAYSIDAEDISENTESLIREIEKQL